MAVAGDGLEQVVSLAGAGPAFFDLGFHIRAPVFGAATGVALQAGLFAAVVAANFEGVAQLVQVLLGGGGIPQGKNCSRLSPIGFRSSSSRQEPVPGCKGRRWPL
jgi:hypothetical protein